MRRTQSKKHKTKTYEINKISLACFDDEILVLDDCIYMFAYYHEELKNSFSQIIINNKRFPKIIMNKKRFSQKK